MSLEIISIIAAIISIALGIIAIYLSITFFKLSKEENTRLTNINNEIISSVKRTETLFRYLHNDIFTLTRDIVAIAWNKESKPEYKYIPRASAELDSFIQYVPKEELTKIAKEQNLTDQNEDKKWDEIQEKLIKTVDKILDYIEKNRPIWAKKAIISLIDDQGTIAQHLYSDFLDLKKFIPRDFFDAVYALKKEGIIDWEGDTLEPDSLIKIKKKTWKYL